ncbi:cytochrome b N-terminal domain-containing protein [Streptomyces sp. NPDC049040]|uniref:cytochrome bc1 complex cytochrome b subunit n=1 Tax=Streptomyces sp. NPDC049040 TaxID=3365593 RepID=UPI003721A69F
MGNESRPDAPRQGRHTGRVAAWAEARLGTRGPAGTTVMRRIFPDRWAFMLGQIVLHSFLILVVTGIYLSLHFHPSSEGKVYRGGYAPMRGQSVSDAFDSTMHISFDVRGGLLIRQAHHWAALIFVAAMFALVMRVFFTGAFRKPRRLLWVIGLLLLILGMLGGLTGYDLPDDLLSGTGLAVVNGTLLSLPVIGTRLSDFLFGGEFPGHEVVAHFNLLHVVVIPILMAALILACVAWSSRQGQNRQVGAGRSRRKLVALPLRAHAVKSVGFFFLVAGVVFLLAAIAQINPIWEYGPYRVDQVSTGSQPDWYMGVADGLLRAMPGWEVTAWGHTLALDNLVPLAATGALFLALGAYPFVEAWVTDDDSEHHLPDRPRNRPVRTALGAAWLALYAVAFLGAANDLIATHFSLSVDAVTWAVRIGLFAAPAVVFALAKRVALGLQKRDRDKVLHGRETGVVKRLPHGGYVEVHEPLSPRQVRLLTDHEQYLPLTPGRVGSADGPDTRTQRLRAGLSRRLYGPGTQILKPTVPEPEDIAAGGHGP